MKFDHKVKYNGVWYEPGEDIEEGVGNTTSSNFSEFMTPPVENKYTKTEINRMPVDELRCLAKKQGFSDVEEINGSDLKRMLIEKLGL